MTLSQAFRLRQTMAIMLGFLALTGCSSKPSQKTSVLTFTVAQNAVIDLTKDQDEFADTLVKYFGTTHAEARRVIDYVIEHNNRNTIAVHAALEIQKSMKDLRGSDPVRTRDEFVVNVMAPYLQCLLHDNPLPHEFKNAVMERYSNAFGIGKAPNGLSAVATSIQSYRTGGSFHADSLNLFNRQILAFGKILQLNNRYQQACLLDVTDTILAPRRWGDSTIWVLETGRGIPCFLGVEYGYSTIHTDYVVVVKDMIRQHAQELHMQLDSTWLGSFYPDRRFAEQVWASLGMGMTRQEADKIVYELLKRDFGGRDISTIAQALEIETAIHEAKHKTDDIDLPTMTMNFDCEVSAHLTQAICGNTPFHGLVDAIQRVEGFYVNSGNPQMATLLVQLWELASNAASPGTSPDTLRAKLVQVYSGYKIGSSTTPLPNLDPFRETLVPALKTGVLHALAKTKG